MPSLPNPPDHLLLNVINKLSVYDVALSHKSHGIHALCDVRIRPIRRVTLCALLNLVSRATIEHVDYICTYRQHSLTLGKQEKKEKELLPE